VLNSRGLPALSAAQVCNKNGNNDKNSLHNVNSLKVDYVDFA